MTEQSPYTLLKALLDPAAEDWLSLRTGRVIRLSSEIDFMAQTAVMHLQRVARVGRARHAMKTGDLRDFAPEPHPGYQPKLRLRYLRLLIRAVVDDNQVASRFTAVVESALRLYLARNLFAHSVVRWAIPKPWEKTEPRIELQSHDAKEKFFKVMWAEPEKYAVRSSVDFWKRAQMIEGIAIYTPDELERLIAELERTAAEMEEIAHFLPDGELRAIPQVPPPRRK